MIRQDQFALGKQRRALHSVAQLAHVARPRIILQTRHRRLGQPCAASGEFRHEQIRQRQNILAPLAQRPDVQLHHVQPVKQILAKTTGLHLFLQIPVARGKDADVRLDFSVRAEALESSILRHAQQFRLERRRHLGDFVQKNRSAVGLLESPDALRRRAGERPLFVAEQFRLQQRFGNRGAIDLGHRPGGARTPRVDHVRHHFLAHAAFAGDEHARFRRRDERDFLEQRRHERAARDDLRRQNFILAITRRGGFGHARGLLDGDEEFVQINRLGEIIDRAVAHGLHSVADVGVGGDEQDGQRGEPLSHALQRFQPGQPGHPHVGNHHVRFLRLQNFKRALAGVGEDGFKALGAQEGIQQAALARIIIHDEDAGRLDVIVLARFGWHAWKLTEAGGSQKEFSWPGFRCASRCKISSAEDASFAAGGEKPARWGAANSNSTPSGV